jgi:hypothetical protein
MLPQTARNTRLRGKLFLYKDGLTQEYYAKTMIFLERSEGRLRDVIKSQEILL